MSDFILLETQLNQSVSSVHQRRDPIARANAAGEVMERLQGTIAQLADIRREAVAEAVLRPNMSMAKVAEQLNLSKSSIAKLASPVLRQTVATDMVARLNSGYTPPDV